MVCFLAQPANWPIGTLLRTFSTTAAAGVGPLAVAAGAGWLARWRGRGWAMAVFGLAWATLHGHWALHRQMPPAAPAQDVRVQGRVVELPHSGPGSTRFVLRVDEAGALLGHVYYLDGIVVEGKKRGRDMGFPTANLRTSNELIPPYGVYATTVTIDGVVHAAVTSIGMNPTFGDLQEAAIETYVLDYSADLYGRSVRLGFVQRLREERRFEDVDGLRAQIEADVRQAVRLFSGLSV